MSFAPSGEQHDLLLGEQRATIVEVGGGVRAYSVAGVEVLQPYARAAMCDAAHGAPLVPWPNRIAGGRYEFAGETHQLPLSEPSRGNAIHGLLRWSPWTARERERQRVVMGARVHPQAGYPFALEVEVEYELAAEGLRASVRARNFGEQRLPYGFGQHPYLSPGPARIDECVLELPARTRLLSDERQIPVAREAVEGGAFDLRTPRLLGAQEIDCAFCDLARGADGRARARLQRPDGCVVELWVDEAFPFLQLYTADGLAQERRRRGLALEPMTCAPDAFNSDDGLLVLAPGESQSASWGVGLLGR